MAYPSYFLKRNDILLSANLLLTISLRERIIFNNIIKNNTIEAT